MSTNILAPFVGVLVLVVGVTLVNQPKTPNANPPYILSSDFYNPNEDDYDQSEEENLFDEKFDPSKPWVKISNRGKKTPDNPKSLGEKGEFDFVNPENELSTGAVYVGEGIFQPKDEIFNGGQDTEEVLKIRFKDGKVHTVGSSDTIYR